MLSSMRHFPGQIISRLRRPDPSAQVAAHAAKLNEFLSWMTAKYFAHLAGLQADSFPSGPGGRESLKQDAEADLRDLLAKGIVRNLGLTAKDGQEMHAWANYYHTLKQVSLYDASTPGAHQLYRIVLWAIHPDRRMVSFSAYLRVLGEVFTDEQGDRWWKPKWQVFRGVLSAVAGSLQEIAISTPLRTFGGEVAISNEIQHALFQILDLVEEKRRAYSLDGHPVLHLDAARIRLHRNIAQANRYVWLPLRSLVNAPLSGNDLELYARTDATAERLARQIVRGDGVILVTGYRGVGKSTLINRALEHHLSAAEKSQMETPSWKVVPVVISLAKVEGVSSALRLSVRRLAETLLEGSTRPTERILAEVLSLDKRVDGVPLLEDERQLLNWAQTRVAFKVGTQQDESMASSRAMRAGVGLQLGELVGKKFLSGSLDFNAGKEWQRKFNKTVELLDYDENHAEDDIVHLIGMLARPRPSADGQKVRLKLVFIFDEMDKMDEETGQEPLIKQLKNLFLTRNAVFLLVTSKKLYYRWLNARRQEDDILSSYFSSVVVVPIFASAETNRLVTNLVYTAGAALSDREETAVDVLARYLTYRAMGVPREIIRELQTMQQWISGSLQPYFSDRSEQYTMMRVYAEIQRSLEQLDTDGAHARDRASQPESESAMMAADLDHLQLGEGRREQIRRGRYVLVEELLNQGNLELSEKALKGLYEGNFEMVSSYSDFEGLFRQLAEQLDRFRFVVEEVPALDARNPALQFFQFSEPATDAPADNTVPRLVVLRDFYELTGRLRPQVSEPVRTATSGNPIEQLSTLLSKQGRFERQLAAGVLSGLSVRDLPRELCDRLYHVFISPDETEGLRVAAAAHVTPQVFAENVAREMPTGFIQSETNERVLAQFVRLSGSIGSLQQVVSSASASGLLMSLLERPTSDGTRTALPDSTAVAIVASLAQIKPRGVLDRVTRALNPRLGANEGLLEALLALAENPPQRLLPLLVERDFHGVPPRSLQKIIQRDGPLQSVAMWSTLSQQSYRSLAVPSMTAILVTLSSTQADADSITPIVTWLSSRDWGLFDKLVLEAAHKADRRSLYALETAVKKLGDADQRTRALYRLADARGEHLETPIPVLPPSRTPDTTNSSGTRWLVIALAILLDLGILVVFFLVPFDLTAGVPLWSRLLGRFCEALYSISALIALVIVFAALIGDSEIVIRFALLAGDIRTRGALKVAGSALIISLASFTGLYWLLKHPLTWVGQLSLLGILVAAILVLYGIIRLWRQTR